MRRDSARMLLPRLEEDTASQVTHHYNPGITTGIAVQGLPGAGVVKSQGYQIIKLDIRVFQGNLPL